MTIVYFLVPVVLAGFAGYSPNAFWHYTTKKNSSGQLSAILCIAVGLGGAYFFESRLFRSISTPAHSAQTRPMPNITTIEKDMVSMPARSLILMKDGKFLLVSRVSTDDRPYTLDVLESPGGQWTRVEFDETKRREIVGIAYPNQGMLYETQATIFLGQ